MLQSLKAFLADFVAPGEKPPASEDELRLAAAALLFHVIAVDGTVAAEERALLGDLLQKHFVLDQNETQQLLNAAESAEAEAVDLYQFTSVLKQRLDAVDRERIIGMMWQLVFADGRLHEFEDNAVWRAAELLGVSTQARIRLKQAARDAR
jgi:uncharacterized tellurite resistance protein B-like protein